MIIAWDVCDRESRLAWRTTTDAGVLSFGNEKPSKVLLSAIDKLVQQHGQIQKMAVLRGPGSFTGIRTGLATAQGLQVSLGIPCYGYTKFQVLAHAKPDATGQLLIKGPRETIYCVDIKDGQLQSEPVQKPITDLDASQAWFSDSKIDGLEVQQIQIDYAAGCAAMAAQETRPGDPLLEPLYIRSADTVVGVPLITKLLEADRS